MTVKWVGSARPDLSEIAALIKRPIAALMFRSRDSPNLEFQRGWYAKALDGSLWLLVDMEAIPITSHQDPEEVYLITAKSASLVCEDRRVN